MYDTDARCVRWRMIAAYKQEEKICNTNKHEVFAQAIGDIPGERVPQSKKRRHGHGYSIPESFNAFCSIVSFTAAKTRRILLVSVACVKLHSEVNQERDKCDRRGATH